MFHVVMVAVLAATPDARPPEPVKLASTGLNAVNIKQDLATFYSDHFAQQLTIQGIRVLTASEISAVIGFERQKELLGCKDENAASCMAELANALGVDGLIVGSLAKFDTSYQVNLKIVGAQNAEPLAVFSGQAEGDKGVIGLLNGAAKQMAPQVKRSLGRDPGPVATATAPPADAPTGVPAPAPTGVTATQKTAGGKSWPWVPTVIGGVAMAAGGFLFLQSHEEINAIHDGGVGNLAEVNDRIDKAGTMRPVGIGLFLAGTATVTTAALLYLMADDAPAQPQAIITPDGASFGVVGVLP